MTKKHSPIDDCEVLSETKLAIKFNRLAMNKYATVQDIVTRLTTDRALRTFFTLYLMAETEAEKAAISARFRKEANAFDAQNRAALFAAFAASFKRLPELAGDLLENIQVANREPALATA